MATKKKTSYNIVIAHYTATHLSRGSGRRQEGGKVQERSRCASVPSSEAGIGVP